MGQGIGILVSKFPKETAASYSLRDPVEVRRIDLLALFRPPIDISIGLKEIERRTNPGGTACIQPLRDSDCVIELLVLAI